MESENNSYPRFISSNPCGIDKYEGKSQERLTNAIVNHIISTDSSDNIQNLSRIIGLEGGWGVGKSNVIKQLKLHNKIVNKYYLFEYDSWGHQEDLQRRSFLEILTTELIKAEILSGKTEISINGGRTKKVSWNEKLKYLLAHKTETSIEKQPQLSIGIIAFVLAAIFTSIFTSIASTLKDNHLILSVFLPFIPFTIAAIIVLIILLKKNRKWKDIFNEIFSIYNGKIENEVSFETINENEPTVSEFKAWMQDISDHINNHEKQKLIVVFNNMDRLPAEKVKELWSSIHTFFSEDGFENVWAIIPFDKGHLARAFGEGDEDNSKQLTKYFISKTFPIVYRVTPPVITDFKQLFNQLFEGAFGNTITQQDDINRIYRLENSNATAREIIEFINQMVALKNIWQNEIDILYIAIFTLKKEELLKPNIAEQILSGEYLGNYIPSIVANDEILQMNISALVYGVTLNIAEQIPMSKYLDSCFHLEVGADINKYADSHIFFQILREKIKNIDTAQLDNIIQCLSKLDDTNFSEVDKKTIDVLWNEIAQRKMAVKLAKQEIDNNFKLLLPHIDNEHKQNIVKYLCKQIQSFEFQFQSFEVFKSENYYSALKDLDTFLRSSNIGIKITDNLTDLEKMPEVFVDYVLSAKEDYPLYKLTVKPDALAKYLSDRVTDKYSDLEVLKYLIKDKKYPLDEVKIKIEETVKNQQLIKKNNFKPLFDAYKILSNEKPLEVQLSPTQRQNIWNVLASNPNTPEYLEIVTIQIANGTNVGGSFDDEQIKYIAENLDYYANYGELLINSLSWNIPILKQALKYMTKNKLGFRLSLEKVLPNFFEIKSNIGVTESILFEQFNRWEKYKNSITKDSIQSIFQNIPQFFQCSYATNNDLTEYLNKTIIETLSSIQSDALYQQRQQPNNFWNIVINNLIDTVFLKLLPDNLTELSKRYLDDIAASRLTIPSTNDIIYKLIEKLDRRKTTAHIKDIRDKYCNSQYNINPQLFIYFESWFEKQDDLKQVANRATHRIIEPVINDSKCLNRILAKPDYYAEIINAAGDDATTLKETINNKIKNNADATLLSFAKKIGVEKENLGKNDK